MTDLRTPPAFLGTITAKRMVRGMLFTDAGAQFTEFSAQRADTDRKYGGAAHPLRREQADVPAITAEANASGRQVMGCLMRHS